jgi:hypothetical protein
MARSRCSSGPTRAATRPALAALSALAILAGGADARAQSVAAVEGSDGAVFAGQIVDSISGDPIRGVLVRIDAGKQAFTDARGEFRITGLPQGRRLYALLSADCRITWGEIDVVDAIPRWERLRLPPAFGAASEEQRREEEERMRTGGRRYTAEHIDRMHVQSATDLIRRVAPNMVGPLSGNPGQTSAIVSSRSRSFTGDDTPVVVIDGVRTPDPASALFDLRASDIGLLEILPGAAAGWEYGSAGASGVIKIALRRGLATGAPERQTARECVVPDFPRR